MTQEEIKDICELHGIEPRGAEMFNEDYIISKTGDLICGLNWGYSIWDNALLETDWLNHLQYKNWFDVRTFLPAYIEALCRQDKKKVMSMVSGRRIIIEPFKLRADKVAMENMIVLLESITKKI